MSSVENPRNRTADPKEETLDRTVDRLISDLHDVPPEQIADAVRIEHARFHGSRVRDFIPILVERAVRRRLSGRASGTDHTRRE